MKIFSTLPCSSRVNDFGNEHESLIKSVELCVLSFSVFFSSIYIFNILLLFLDGWRLEDKRARCDDDREQSKLMRSKHLTGEEWKRQQQEYEKFIYEGTC